MTQATLITSVTTDSLTDLLQGAGYRVNQTEQNGIVQLLSASQGIGYAVRFGNPADEAGHYVDFTYSCALRVQGELPAGLAELWNASRRFARLSLQGEFLVMEMDVVVAGVSDSYLRGQLELWDRLLQEFIVYLREYSQQAARLQAGAPEAASAEEALL
ncbi:YbjN domain-containing protein [Pseudomonas sp. L5B5]|uniref:YbjN domain-containing protein n=1 Tax=Pseudomonas sp. L5B5 TaxID=2883205 RepID=UPI001CFB38A7|nr:YbjN domain-containing protein [Pseudomonas sp. L5B5]UCZ85815.1 YbjN domain-containing protein [Pseudomonas sp. L5B5]